MNLLDAVSFPIATFSLMKNIEKKLKIGKVASDRDQVSSEKSLFRSQAIEFAKSQSYGTVIIKSYINHNILVFFFCVIAVAIIGFFMLFTTTRNVQVSGVLLPEKGLIRVKPGQSSVVKKINVEEGQEIKSGDVLFVLNNEHQTGSNQSAEKTVSTLLKNRSDSYHEELLDAKQQSVRKTSWIHKKIEDLLQDGARLDEQISLQKSRIELTENIFQRFKELYSNKYISIAQLEEKEANLLDQRQRLVDLIRLKGTNEREYNAAEAEYHDLRYQTQRDIAAVKRGELTVQQDLAESEARREVYMAAPISGRIITVMAEIGKLVSADSTLASIVPVDSKLVAEIYAPSRSVGFVRPGMKVLLRYQAYPYQKFGQYEATVYEVGGTPISIQETMLSETTNALNLSSEPLYRIRLKLKQQSVLAYGKPISLKVGMLLNANIIVERRHLYEWILEPLFSIYGRI